MQEETTQLKQLRADLDLMIVLANQLRDSRFTSLACTALEAGKMHVGNTMYELGIAEVYVNSKDASNNTIEPYHVDKEITPMKTPEDWNGFGLTENVKIMRRELSTINQRVKDLVQHGLLVSGNRRDIFSRVFLIQAVVNLREAINWYGMELGRIRETEIAA